MIDFPCPCGFAFSVPQELAGSNIQCPQCMRLNDVPKLSELGGLDNDGTIKLLDPEPELENRERADRLVEIFRPGRMDDDGDEIDLRVTMDDIRKAGVVDEQALGLRKETMPPEPKYDPVTGELIEILDIKRPEGIVRAIPLGAPAPSGTLTYATAPLHDRVSFKTLIRGLLLTPGSLVVLVVLFGVHLLSLMPLMLFGIGGYFLGFIVILGAVVLLFAHYANIVEDVGPMDLDELSTPLRGAEFGSDIIHPFLNFTSALFICYMPAVLVMGKFQHVAAGLAVAVVSTFMFPAVFLTLCTSGDLTNIRPDRVLGVITAARGHYAVSVMLWVLASMVYGAGILGSNLYAAATINWLFMGAKIGVQLAISLLLLVVGILLMHTFCWHLGLLYRRCHSRFPWVLQEFVGKKAEQPVRRRRRPFMIPPPPRAIGVPPHRA